jgi:hypothetical protein
MRITKDSMLRLARDTAAISANQDRSIICIYLTGSVVTEDPFIGGSTDIDLFYVHTNKPEITREIRYLSDDVSLDIAHIEQVRFQQPRHLRADAWLGPFLCAKPKVLYDTQHWFEFTEASVAAQFYRPEYVLERARPLASAARQTWMEFHLVQPEVNPMNILRYLQAVENAGNAIALLSGSALPARRFMMDIDNRLVKVKRSDLIAKFNSLVLPPNMSDLDWTQWITGWEPVMIQAAQMKACPSSMSAPRRNYYTKAVNALSDDRPAAAAWLMLNSWTRAISLLPSESSFQQNWKLACGTFLQVNESFRPIWEQLDDLLDSVEETLDTFVAENGLTE